MPATYNATQHEMLYQQLLLTQPITIPSNGSVTLRVISITKNTNIAEDNENEP